MTYIIINLSCFQNIHSFHASSQPLSSIYFFIVSFALYNQVVGEVSMDLEIFQNTFFGRRVQTWKKQDLEEIMRILGIQISDGSKSEILCEVLASWRDHNVSLDQVLQIQHIKTPEDTEEIHIYSGAIKKAFGRI